MRFSATEAGYQDGLGGASNSRSSTKYHYILFGLQDDKQHPGNSGIYFEYDDQINGSVNCVERILVSDTMATFVLNDSTEIMVQSKVTQTEWQNFLRGVVAVFGTNKIDNPNSLA
jgi:hypothetical protein